MNKSLLIAKARKLKLRSSRLCIMVMKRTLRTNAQCKRDIQLLVAAQDGQRHRIAGRLMQDKITDQSSNTCTGWPSTAMIKSPPEFKFVVLVGCVPARIPAWSAGPPGVTLVTYAPVVLFKPSSSMIFSGRLSSVVMPR